MGELPLLRQAPSLRHLYGDEGGIVCKLDLEPDIERDAFLSIAHLHSDARLPLARDIAACQKHCVKRLNWPRAAYGSARSC